jgi:hypothetical protein
MNAGGGKTETGSAGRDRWGNSPLTTAHSRQPHQRLIDGFRSEEPAQPNQPTAGRNTRVKPPRVACWAQVTPPTGVKPPLTWLPSHGGFSAHPQLFGLFACPAGPARQKAQAATPTTSGFGMAQPTRRNAPNTKEDQRFTRHVRLALSRHKRSC